MSIRIDEKKCVGCRQCVDICPGNLIKIADNGKAMIRDVRDCWGCATCVKICPCNAIRMFLGADIGGDGTTMFVQQIGDNLHWVIDTPDINLKKRKFIDTNRRRSNRY